MKVLDTMEAFDAAIKASKKKLTVVDFTASWCGPCQQIAPIYERMAKEMPSVSFFKCDVDENQEAAESCQITAMPTFQLFFRKKLVSQVQGADMKSLYAAIMDALEKERDTDSASKACSAQEASSATKKAKRATEAEASETVEPTGLGDGSSAAGKKRTRDAETDEGSLGNESGKLGHGGKRVRGQPQPSIDTETKPIKWKKIIAKELKSEGGSMGLKALRKACVAEARAHPSYKGRDKERVQEEFDESLPTFHKFKVHNNTVSLAPEGQ